MKVQDADKIMLLCNAIYELTNDLAYELQGQDEFAELGQRLAILFSEIYTDVELPILKQYESVRSSRTRARHKTQSE